MPISVTDEGPIQAGENGNPFYLRKIVDERVWRVICDEQPISITRDLEPPECWEQKIYHCRHVQFEKYRVQIREANEKPKGLFYYLGAGLMLLGAAALVVITGGGALIALGVIKVSAGALAVAGVLATSAVASAGTIGAGAAIIRLDPDEYEVGAVLNTESKEEEINSRPYPQRIERTRIQCPPVTTGGDGSGGNSDGESENDSENSGGDGTGGGGDGSGHGSQNQNENDRSNQSQENTGNQNPQNGGETPENGENENQGEAENRQNDRHSPC